MRAILDAHRKTFEELGCLVEDAHPDLSGADSIFLTIRAWRNAAVLGPLLSGDRQRLKPEAIGEIERGEALSGADVARALVAHGELMERVRRFEEQYEFTICAVNQVPPFDAALDWPKAIDGVTLDSYVAWMKSAYWISVTCRPAISVPAGFTPDGLPVGIQIVGRHRDDLGVLQVARAFEEATGVGLYAAADSGDFRLKPEARGFGSPQNLEATDSLWLPPSPLDHGRGVLSEAKGRRKRCEP